MKDLFPNTVSYNRFVELEQKVAIPFILFVKRCCMGGCTGSSFVDSTALRVCRNQRIHCHKVFKGLAAYSFFPKKPMIDLERNSPCENGLIQLSFF